MQLQEGKSDVFLPYFGWLCLLFPLLFQFGLILIPIQLDIFVK